MNFYVFLFSNVNQIKFGQKNTNFRFLGLQGFFSFFLHFATAFVGKNARKLLTIFLNDEFIFLVSFLPSYFFFRFLTTSSYSRGR